MKFQVIGSNRSTGARMVLEFEAESRAAAERKANQQGMAVNRVVDISDGYVGIASDPNPNAGRRRGKGGMIKYVILLAIIAAAVWYFRGSIPGLH
jgi:hypothetical protein